MKITLTLFLLCITQITFADNFNQKIDEYQQHYRIVVIDSIETKTMMYLDENWGEFLSIFAYEERNFLFTTFKLPIHYATIDFENFKNAKKGDQFHTICQKYDINDDDNLKKTYPVFIILNAWKIK